MLCTAKTEKYGLLGSPKQGRKYPWIDLKLLKNETFLLLKNNMRLGQFSEKVLSEYGMTPEIMELNSIDTALALVGQQYGVAFACGFKLEEHANAKEILCFPLGMRLLSGILWPRLTLLMRCGVPPGIWSI